jgi:hypothetical protein
MVDVFMSVISGLVIFFPSPLVGEGGSIVRSAIETGEGFVSAETDLSSGATRHLLPQGEKEELIPSPPLPP